MANVVPADRPQGELAGVFGKGLGDAQTDIAASELDAALATDAEVAAGGPANIVVTSLDGALETTPPNEIYSVPSMQATSVVLSVLFVSTKASVATIEVLDPADFTPGVDTLTSLTEVDRTNDQLIVTWLDV